MEPFSCMPPVQILSRSEWGPKALEWMELDPLLFLQLHMRLIASLVRGWEARIICWPTWNRLMSLMWCYSVSTKGLKSNGEFLHIWCFSHWSVLSGRCRKALPALSREDCSPQCCKSGTCHKHWSSCYIGQTLSFVFSLMFSQLHLINTVFSLLLKEVVINFLSDTSALSSWHKSLKNSKNSFA